jgi:two-component system NtrC family response regulator
MDDTMPRILLIEDDDSSRELGQFNLTRAGYEVDTAPDGDQGLRRFTSGRYDLVITDLRMPGRSGMEVLAEVKRAEPDVPVIVVTAYANVDLAVDAMKTGAQDFIGKPFNRDHLVLAVRKALEDRSLRREVRRLRVKASGIERPLVCASEPMRRLVETADRVARSEATVLITGESGTGKELIARRIHVRSNRAEGPFVALNCAAVPGELLEAELFGHEKGAFTGAARARQGRFRKAEGGTLFLDEVAEIPAQMQSKLLRVLQEKVVDVVGSDTPAPVDVRIIAATNKDLRQRIEQSVFREDLYYRLAVIELALPPLRERPEDIPPLVDHFVARFGGDRDLAVSRELLDDLKRRAWPGNVRELENVCERLVLLAAGDELSPDDLPPQRIESDPAAGRPNDGPRDEWPPLPDGGLSLIELERRVIERVLVRERWNVSQAARYLRIPRHILTYRMEKHGIRRP